MRLLTSLIAAACLGAPAISAAQAAPPAAAAAAGEAATPPTTPVATKAAVTGAAANTTAIATGLSVGQSVKDNTGVLIGQITDLRTDTDGKQVAVVQMGADAFSVETDRLAVQNGAAAINATGAQIRAMIRRAAR